MEAPTLVDLQQRQGPDKLNLLYLNARDPHTPRPELSAFVESMGMDRNAYAIIDDANLSTLTNDDRNLIPRTYVFDRAGKPVAMIVGYKPLALNRLGGLLR